ncbi:MAG: hypothetical protein ABI858_06905 [Pseudoxanthomonas sp.]
MRNCTITAGLMTVLVTLAGCGKSVSEAPSEAEVQAAARQQFANQLAGPDVSAQDRKLYTDALSAAKFAPKPQCVKGGEKAYACVLEMTGTMPGDAAPTQQPVMVELVKGNDGWQAAPMP